MLKLAAGKILGLFHSIACGGGLAWALDSTITLPHIDLMPKKKKLDIEMLVAEAARFAEVESTYDEPSLYGVTDGKAVGTYLEHKFTQYLAGKYEHQQGNSASGIDLPDLGVDIKVTSIRQPQSSCPFRSARQKIYGLGYNLWSLSMRRPTTR